MRFGQYIAKFSLATACAPLAALKGVGVPIAQSPNALRERVQEYFNSDQAVWELRARLCRDLNRMPVEDSSIVWPEPISPHRPIARVVVPRQIAWSDARAREIEDGTSFSPWHGIEDHRPLGSIMRARKGAYDASIRFRTEHNARSIAEPKGAPVVLS
jgi:hypothetical protein